MSDRAPLEALVKVVNDKVSVDKDSSLPYLGLEHLQRGGGIQGCAVAEDSISTNSVFSKFDVLFGKLRPNLRKAALAPFDGYCSTDILVLRPRDQVSPRFAGWVFQSEEVGAAAERTAIGTKMPRTSWHNLKREMVFFPSVAEQSQIAQILDTLDIQIRQTEALIAKLETVKQGLLTDLLTRGIDENGQLRPPPEEAPGLYKESSLGLIPISWEAESLGLLSAQSAIGPFGSDLVADDYRSRGIPVVFVRDIKAGGFQWNSQVYVSSDKATELRSHQVRPGDVLLTKMGLPPCVSCVYPEWMPKGVITADVIRLRVQPQDARAAWISEYVNSVQVARQVRAITAGVTRPKVTLADARSLLAAVPTLREQDEILTRIEPINGSLTQHRFQLNQLALLKSGLMDDLLTGRVRVTPLLGTVKTPETSRS